MMMGDLGIMEVGDNVHFEKPSLGITRLGKKHLSFRINAYYIAYLKIMDCRLMNYEITINNSMTSYNTINQFVYKTKIYWINCKTLDRWRIYL